MRAPPLPKNAVKTPSPDVWLQPRELGWPNEISTALPPYRCRAAKALCLSKGAFTMNAVKQGA